MFTSRKERETYRYIHRLPFQKETLKRQRRPQVVNGGLDLVSNKIKSKNVNVSISDEEYIRVDTLNKNNSYRG